MDRRKKKREEAAKLEEEKKKRASELEAAAQERAEEEEFVRKQQAANGMDDSDDDDPDAKLKSIHNLKPGAGGGDPENSESRRNLLYHYDEMASYTNRSERSHEQNEDALSKDELKKRKVRIHEQVTLVDHVGEGMTEEEMASYYMQEEDFRRCDADVELTTFRWEKAKKRGGKFDEAENSLRGLEDVIAPDARRENLRNRHTQSILTETMKQRAAGNEILDWEKIRSVAEKTSKISAKYAEDVANQDSLEAKGVGRSSSQRFKSLTNSRTHDTNNRMSMGKMRLMFSFKKKK